MLIGFPVGKLQLPEEAEVVAGADGLQSAAPLLAVMEGFFTETFLSNCTDSDAARTAIATDDSRKLRHMTKNQGICFGFVNDGLCHMGGDMVRHQAFAPHCFSQTSHYEIMSIVAKGAS